MNETIEQQLDRAARIEKLVGPLLACESEQTRSIAEEVSTLAALIEEDLRLALDAS